MIAIISINHPSLKSALRLAEFFHEDEVVIYAKEAICDERVRCYEKLDDILAPLWQQAQAIIFFVATGIVIRKIAPLLVHKSQDPAIVVMSLALDRVIPLLSGHLGGANALATRLSEAFGAINFITTATDQAECLAFDMVAKEREWKIEHLHCLASVSNRLINKETITVSTTPKIFDSLPPSSLSYHHSSEEGDVVIYPYKTYARHDVLLLKPSFVIGFGCNRGVSYDAISMAIEQFCDSYNLDIHCLKAIASFDKKRDEEGLLTYALEHKLPLFFYDETRINEVCHVVSRSASEKFFGIKGVAEPCALLASTYHELIVPKTVYFQSITIAGAI